MAYTNMVYPSKAGEFSHGVQSGIQLGIQMKQQREEEDKNLWQKQKFEEQQREEEEKNLWQKQKFEEQQTFNKAVQATDPLKHILTGKYPEATQARAYEALKKIWGGLGVNFPEIDFSRDSQAKDFVRDAAAIMDGIKVTGHAAAAEAFEDLKLKYSFKMDDPEIKSQIEGIDKILKPKAEAENLRMGMAALPYSDTDSSYTGYLSKAGKAGTDILEKMAIPKEKKYAPETRDQMIEDLKEKERIKNTYDKSASRDARKDKREEEKLKRDRVNAYNAELGKIKNWVAGEEVKARGVNDNSIKNAKLKSIYDYAQSAYDDLAVKYPDLYNIGKKANKDNSGKNNNEQLIKAANDAVARGADPKKVRERLNKLGVK